MDLELDFSTEGYENTSVSKDFAFVYKNGKTKVVFPSGTEHKVAIVEIPETGDIRDGDVQINYVPFNTDEFIQGRAPHGRYRRIEWAVGTDYVWVNDGSLEELYVFFLSSSFYVRYWCIGMDLTAMSKFNLKRRKFY